MPGLAYHKGSQSNSGHNPPSSSPSSSPSPSSSSSSSASDRNGGRSASSHRRASIEASQLNKFWRDLSSCARKELLRIDKHTLFEQVRRNLYCSRCNGLLLEAFSQLVSYSKSMQGSSCYGRKILGCNKTHTERRESEVVCVAEDDVRDPSVHPWGGLIATRENTLTLLDCFVEGQPLEVIQNVCDCARARERERQLLYPDACGGGGRGWISQGASISSSCRGHNLKETCALHTARLSCDALVDFWSALGEETRKSLLRMKEEDFVARLMFRFDSKRFCRDCRRNVLRELKELKELKRARKEPKCTRWFCNADTAFSYEVSNTSVLANWSDCFGGDLASTYEHFEWGLGSTEGNCDILSFEDVGLSDGARVDGLDLSQFSFFYITLRAWKHDGRCTELSVKAHGLKGRHCVHRRLLVGDGHVTITKGDSIKRFFEQAEEAEEEEDEEASDKNGSDPESEGFRVQKHAKSPELARDFLLDAATIIFKEQVEKAFREGTARQNAHTIFVCLALNLLEERVHVACKEISTLEMQKQLLEEEEHEKREEEMRRERRRLKEKEKKNRRKEKQKNLKRGKERTKSDSSACSNLTDCVSSLTDLHDGNVDAYSDNEIKESAEASDGGKANEELMDSQSSPVGALDVQVADISECNFDFSASMERSEVPDGGEMFVVEQSKASKRRSKMRRGTLMEIVPHRSLRQSDVGSRSFTNLSSSSSLNELQEKELHGIQKHHRKATKSDRTMCSTSVSVETWTNVRYQREMSPSYQISTKRSLYVKNMQKDNVKESLETRSLDKKNTSKKINRVGCIVAGPVQCNWQVVKGASGVAMKKGSSGESSVSNTVIPGSSNNVEDASPAGSDRSLSRNSFDGCNDQEDEGISEQQGDMNGLDGYALTCSGSEVESSIGSIKVEKAFKCPSDLAPSGKEKSLPRLLPISTSGSVDEDTSPSSSSSFFTDTSDNGITSSSVTTDSSYVESAEASASEVSMEVPRCQGTYNECNEAMHYTSVNEECLQYDFPSYNADDYNPYNNFACTEFYPFSCDPNVIAYSHDYTCAYEPVPLGIHPDVQVIDVTSNLCEIDSTMHIPLTSQSLLPLQPSQPFGYSWVHGQCVGAPVMNGGLTPFHHPGSFYLDVVPSSNAIDPSGLLPIPPFQHSTTVVGYNCLPELSAEQTYTCWTDQQIVYKDELQCESPLLGHSSNSQQVPGSNLCPKEEERTDTSSGTGLSGPSNDPLGKFSLFHFGSLSPEEQERSTAITQKENKNGDANNLNISCSRSVQQESAGIQNRDQPENEYHLFAATPSNRFSFFKEKLHECWQAPFIL